MDLGIDGQLPTRQHAKHAAIHAVKRLFKNTRFF